VIQAAPITMTFAWVIGLLVMWMIMDKYVYRQRLEAKDDLIKTYREKLGLLPEGAPKGAVGARRLSAEQRMQIIKHIRENMGEPSQDRFLVVIGIPTGDCASYAGDFHLTFEAAGLKPSLGRVVPGPKPTTFEYRTGMYLRGCDRREPPTNKLIAEALNAAGIKPTAVDPGREGPVQLIIGNQE